MIDELTLEERVAIDCLIEFGARWGEHLSACGLHAQADEVYVAVDVAYALLARDLERTS